MRRAKETNWGYRLVERRDLLARKEIIMVDLGQHFDPTVDPALLGTIIVPNRKSIRNGYVHFHCPPLSRQHKVELTATIGKSRSPLRFWIRA